MAAPTREGTLVRLGGRDWVLADLAPRQYRKVIPALVALDPLRSVGDLDEAKIDRLVEAYYLALTRAHPDLTREEWEEVPVSVIEMIDALPTLARKAGLVPRKDGEPGEASGPTVGTESSMA
jgi:hypothetical protein